MSDDLCLKWNDHRPTFLRSLSQLCLSDRLADVLISCGHSHFPAHRLVLTICSDYFADLFESNPHLEAPGIRAVVCLKDVDPANMESLLAYMYCGEVTVKEQELVSFLALAKNLQVKGLALPDVQNGDNSNELETSTQNQVRTRSSDVSGRKKRKRDDDSAIFTPPIERRSIKTELTQRVEDESDDNEDSRIAPSADTDDSQAMEESTERDEIGDGEGNDGLVANQEMYEEEPLEDFVGVTAAYRTISGRHQNSKIYACEGHMYVNCKKKPTKTGRPKWFLGCRHRHCKGRAVLWVDTDMITMTRAHTCSDNHIHVSTKEAMEEMKKKCFETSDSIKEIFNVTIADRPELTNHLTYDTMNANLRRWRSQALEKLINEKQ